MTSAVFEVRVKQEMRHLRRGNYLREGRACLWLVIRLSKVGWVKLLSQEWCFEFSELCVELVEHEDHHGFIAFMLEE